jgi:hypothetical protein
MFRNRALNGRFTLHNKTNKCTDVKCVYHMLLLGRAVA